MITGIGSGAFRASALGALSRAGRERIIAHDAFRPTAHHVRPRRVALDRLLGPVFQPIVNLGAPS